MSRCALAELVRSSRGGFEIRGAGTRRGPASPLRGETTPLSTLGLDAVREHEPAEMVITLEAGCRFDRIDPLLAAHGQRLGVRPLLPAGATLGGLVAADACGPLRHRFGGWRDQLLGMTLLLADGSEVRAGGKVVKNVAGYDLCKLAVGSFGTLGVLTELSLRLHPRPALRGVLRLVLESTAIAPPVVEALRRMRIQPSGFLVSAGPEEVGAAQVRIMLEGRPEAVAETRDGIRAGVAGDWSWHEGADLADLQDECLTRTRAAGGVWLRGGLPVSTAVLDHLAAAGGGSGSGGGEVHVDPGTGELHWFLAGSGAADFARTKRATLEAVGGFLVVQEGLPELDAWGSTPGTFALMKAVKEAFDPTHRWNPGRAPGGL